MPRFDRLVLLTLLAWPTVTSGQEAQDPHGVLPERPTVATHAWTVTTGYAEVETGVEWDANRDDTHGLSTPTLLKLGLAHRFQLGIQTTLTRPAGSTLAPGDLAFLLKIRLADRLPLLGAVAILPGIKVPTGDAAHGTTTTDLSLLAISSHQLGPVGLDVNLGYTRRSGGGRLAPRDATLWTVAAGWPLSGALGATAELFGYPGTTGPAGSPATAAVLAGPTYSINRRWVIDLGGILHLTGPQPDAIYAGLVYNLGRLWGSPPP